MAEISSQKIKVGVAIAVVLPIIGFALNYNSRIQSIEADAENCKEEEQRATKRLEDLENRTRQSELQYIEIKTKLTNIEFTMLEIKDALKKHDTK